MGKARNRHVVRRSYDLAEGLVGRLDEWVARTGVSPTRAVEVGLWAVMSMDPAERQDAMDRMLADLGKGKGDAAPKAK